MDALIGPPRDRLWVDAPTSGSRRTPPLRAARDDRGELRVAGRVPRETSAIAVAWVCSWRRPQMIVSVYHGFQKKALAQVTGEGRSRAIFVRSTSTRVFAESKILRASRSE